MLHELRTPDLGIAASPAAVSLWLVRTGDEVVEGAPVVELLAGPAVVDVPSPVDGVLAARLVGEDEAVAPRQVLGIIESPDADEGTLDERVG